MQAVNQHVGQGRPIFYTCDVAPIELPADDPDGQTALYPGLEVRGPVVDKGPGKYGGFSGFVLSCPGGGPGHGGLSRLAGHLHSADVDRVVVVGLAADVCVSATARDARRLGHQVDIPLQATAFVQAHPEVTTPRSAIWSTPASPSMAGRAIRACPPGDAMGSVRP